MKLAYQVAMPDLESSPLLTAYQGSLEDSFRHLAENGYQGIELMVRDPQKLDPELLNRLTSTYGLEVVMLATGEIWAQDHISLSSSNPENRLRCIKRFKEFIDCAAPYHAQVNIGRVRGELVPGIPPETTLDLAVDAFRQLASYAEDKGVTIALEPVNFLQCNFINSTAEGRDIVDRVGYQNFRIMLDVFHMNIQDADIFEEIQRSKGYFSYVHLCDNNRLYPGNCGLDFPKIMQSLHAVDYEGYVSVEVLQLPSGDVALTESAQCLLPLL